MTENNIKMTPSRISIERPDGVIAGWRWQNDGASPLLFCHATGFCASAYKQMLQHLSGRFDVFALDMRGHGKTTLPTEIGRFRSWDVYAADISAVLDQYAKTGWTLAGHSMGAIVVTMAARGRSDIGAINLVEPVAMPPITRILAQTPFWPIIARQFSLTRSALQRRSSWSARDDVLASYERKPVFRHWAPGVLSDYLEDGLTEESGGVRLSCNPTWEAATFQAHANDFWGAVRAAPAPISVLAADHRSSTVVAGADRRFERAGARIRKQTGVSHLIPMEMPDLAAQFVSDG